MRPEPHGSPAVASLRFQVARLGVLMTPAPDQPWEVEGVLNPAGVRGPDGHYYLFPRLVAAGNYSRIGVARVTRDATGRPAGVQRLGLALEPEQPYERVQPGRGGCEDPRVTFLAHAHTFVMAYTALGPQGAHVALATARDLHTWTRRGLVDFAPEHGVDFNAYANKDALLLPEPVTDPAGRPALALLHRPVYETWSGINGRTHVPAPPPPQVGEARPSIWISYCPLEETAWLEGAAPPRFRHHRLVAAPTAPWEAYRIGGGTVPLWTEQGWLLFYHGVTLAADGGRCYQAGALLLDHADPGRVVARTATPLFGPETPEERVGIVDNVVFPTAVDPRAGGLDVYYGMADARIGVVHLQALTPEAAAEADAVA